MPTTYAAEVGPADYGFTSAQISSYRETFDLFDADGDGAVSTKELGEMFAKLGMKLTEDVLRGMMDGLDADQTGTMSLKEFYFFMAKTDKMANDLKSELRTVFNRFDLNHDNHIQPEELQSALQLIGEKMSLEDVNKIFCAGQSGEAGMTFEDFQRLMEAVL